MKSVAIGGFFHDLNFSLYDSEKRLLLSAEEERFSRQKMHSVLNCDKTSVESLEWMLNEAGLNISDIDTVFYSDTKEQRIYGFFDSLFSNARKVRIGHHISHIYNVIALNPIIRGLEEDIRCFCFDAFGDGASGCKGTWSKIGGLSIERTFPEEFSLGILYTAATSHLGFGGFGSEGKMQGLASYGKYKQEYSIAEYIRCEDGMPFVEQEIKRQSGWQKQEQYVNIGVQVNEFLSEIIDRRFSDEEISEEHCDFARTIQTDIFHVIKDSLIEAGFGSNVLISGGIAQNSTLINYLAEELDVRILTSTSCSDRGNSLGALCAGIEEHNIEASPFLGLNAETLEVPESFTRITNTENNNAVELAARLLAEGKLVATLISRAELGARALGNRSILSAACDSRRKEYLNHDVKHRESFRPFAPIILERNTEYALEHPIRSGYMTQCVSVSSDFKKEYPSAVHVDNTARVQIHGTETPANLVISTLLDRLDEEWGIRAILNTSFNDAGEPIVNNYFDALKTMKSCGIEYLLDSDSLYRVGDEA